MKYALANENLKADLFWKKEVSLKEIEPNIVSLAVTNGQGARKPKIRSTVRCLAVGVGDDTAMAKTAGNEGHGPSMGSVF